MWSSPRRSRGFTLIELAVALLVIALIASSVALPLAAQLQARRADEVRRQFDDAREALLGFAAAHARLPCPASATSRGDESFAAGGDATNGDCSNFYDGYLPAAALGLAPLDSQGYLRDPWMTEKNRVRYAVFGGGTAVNGVVNPLTRANGMQAATLAGLGAEPHYIFICSTGAAASGSGCGPAANQLTFRAAFVLLSLGANANETPAAGGDEARNVSGAPVFVHHEATVNGNAGFDDVVQWVPVHLVVHRLLTAGRLP
ncbi:MAG TPA: type II secretion system protein [Usitatibacter sp.]|jgi:prepilin-type N-terminal cleavage/methylation domain-containing protein|nr:type II secretion system protein [Usitatibacter sp.]